MLKVENLSFRYRKKKVLNNISFELDYGQSVCLLGKNGVGKSTLFKCLLQHVKGFDGDIFLYDKPLSTYSRSELAQQISYIPQKKRSNIQFTVFEMVLMGTTARLKNYQQPGEKEIFLAEQALERLKIQHLKHALFSEISGGEQQLTIIARSVAQQSKIIIMDEPCANLDYGNQVKVLEMIRELSISGYLIIQSTHDPNHALQYADHVLVLQDGSLATSGRPEEILTSERLATIYQVPVSVHFLQEIDQFICIPNKKESLHVEVI